MNSNDVFVFHGKSYGSYLWFGRGSSGDEREVGRIAARHITGAPEIDTVAEGQEPHEFWAGLGGKAAYSSGKEFEEDSEIDPRLFNMSNATGRFLCEEGKVPDRYSAL